MSWGLVLRAATITCEGCTGAFPLVRCYVQISDCLAHWLFLAEHLSLLEHHVSELFRFIPRTKLAVVVHGRCTLICQVVAIACNRRDKREIVLTASEDGGLRLALEVLTDSTIGIARHVFLYQRATLLVLKLSGCGCHFHGRLFGLLEELVVVEWVDARLRFDFNVKSTMVVLLTDADRVHIAVDGHQGPQRIAKCRIVPISLDLFDKVINRVEHVCTDAVPKL